MQFDWCWFFCGGGWLYCCLCLFWRKCWLLCTCECWVFCIRSVKFCLTVCQFGVLVDLRFLHGGCVATAGRVYSSRAPIDTLNRFESPCQHFDVVLSYVFLICPLPIFPRYCLSLTYDFWFDPLVSSTVYFTPLLEYAVLQYNCRSSLTVVRILVSNTERGFVEHFDDPAIYLCLYGFLWHSGIK